MPGTDGFVMVPNSLIESKLSIWATAVWIALKYHADRNGGCYPSREALAKASKMSLPQVTRALRELREAGMIDANLRAGRTSVYDLPVCSIRSSCDPIDQESDPIDQGVCSNRSDTLFAPDSNEQDPINKTQEQEKIATKKNGRPNRPLFDTIAEVTNSDPKVSGSHIAKLEKLLNSAEPPYTPEEVRSLSGKLSKMFEWFDGTLTLGIIEKYIGHARAKGPKRVFSDEDLEHGDYDGRSFTKNARTCDNPSCKRPACVLARKEHINGFRHARAL